MLGWPQQCYYPVSHRLYRGCHSPCDTSINSISREILLHAHLSQWEMIIKAHHEIGARRGHVKGRYQKWWLWPRAAQASIIWTWVAQGENCFGLAQTTHSWQSPRAEVGQCGEAPWRGLGAGASPKLGLVVEEDFSRDKGRPGRGPCHQEDTKSCWTETQVKGLTPLSSAQLLQ